MCEELTIISFFLKDLFYVEFVDPCSDLWSALISGHSTHISHLSLTYISSSNEQTSQLIISYKIIISYPLMSETLRFTKVFSLGINVKNELIFLFLCKI